MFQYFCVIVLTFLSHMELGILLDENKSASYVSNKYLKHEHFALIVALLLGSLI